MIDLFRRKEMNFEDEMEIYFKLKTLNERIEKIDEIVVQLEKLQKMKDPVIVLNLAEVIMEYCLLIENNNSRMQQYDRALELVYKARSLAEKEYLIRQILRSYHLECFIKYHTMKYKEEDASINDILNLGEIIIDNVTKFQKLESSVEYDDYHSLGCVWYTQGLIFQLISKSREMNFEQRHNIVENVIKLAHKAVKLSKNTRNRDAHILSAYIFAYAEQLPQIMLRGDKATTEEDFIGFMYLYDILAEIAEAHGSFEFDYLALLNKSRLKLLRIIYAAGVSERKKEMFDEILEDCYNLDKYEKLIFLPHLHFYKYELKTKVYTSIVYFEVVKEDKFKNYINKAMKSAERMKYIYKSSNMESTRDKVEMHHYLNEIYKMNATFATSRSQKLEFLKKSEELLLEDEKISVTWSPHIYYTWRDLSSIYFDLSKVERNQTYFKKCVKYATKSYKSALETDEFKDALFEAYKIAIIAEDYQKYSLSIKHYELGYNLTDKIILAGKDYPYYHDLKKYLQARLLGVKAKESHLQGNYEHAMKLYQKTSSLLQLNEFFSYEGLLYNAYAFFEEASMRFIEEEYNKTLEILSKITRLFEETLEHQIEYYKTQFQYFIDRRAYDLQQLFFEAAKAFCIAQSFMLQSLICRNIGESQEAIELLKEANTLLSQFRDRDIHIEGYYSFINGLFGLEQSEVALKDSEYKNAASYLASATDQFETASQVLSSDEALKNLCEGLKSFCQGWMYALEIMRRGVDLNLSELNKKYELAHQSLIDATRMLKMFKKTYSSVLGFEKLVSYIYNSLLFQKNDNPIEKDKFKDNMVEELTGALNYFKDAEDMERYGFTRDLLNNLPHLEELPENIFKLVEIPFTPYTPVFDTTNKVEPRGLDFVVSVDKTQVEVNEKIIYKIQITSDTSVHVNNIEGIFPKKGIKIISGIRMAKNGGMKIDRLFSPGQSMNIEVLVRVTEPLYSKKHPQLFYFTMKNEKYRAFATPITLQVFPKNLLKVGVVNEIREKVETIWDIMDELGIHVGKFPIVYHNLNSFRETLSEYFNFNDNKGHKNKRRSTRLHVSRIPIQQMAFVDPLGDVNILYDMNKYIYPDSIAGLLNIIIHEKFGHGFFYQNTILGRKLLELEYHRKGIGLLTKELEKISDKYAIGVQWFSVSTLIVNEGFAVWLVLKTLEKILERTPKKNQEFSQQVLNEIKSIKNRISDTKNLNVDHEYFTLKYGQSINPYELGYDLFQQIEDNYGEKCVSKALEIAADVPLTRRQISRMPYTLKNDKKCADKRLEKIVQSNLQIDLNNVDMFEKAAKKLV